MATNGEADEVGKVTGNAAPAPPEALPVPPPPPPPPAIVTFISEGVGAAYEIPDTNKDAWAPHVPRTTLAHACADVAPTAAVVVPPAHAVQLVVPVASVLYVPRLHAVHALPYVMLPTPQALHTSEDMAPEAAVDAYSPAAHTVQPDVPETRSL